MGSVLCFCLRSTMRVWSRTASISAPGKDYAFGEGASRTCRDDRSVTKQQKPQNRGPRKPFFGLSIGMGSDET